MRGLKRLTGDTRPHLFEDERGQSVSVEFIVSQPIIWLLVAVLIAVVMLGLRRYSAGLATHNAGLAAGREDVAAGQGAAEHILNVWWGETAPVVVTEDGATRSVQVQLDAEWGTAAEGTLGLLSIQASSWQRKEGFYAGPPSEDGFE